MSDQSLFHGPNAGYALELYDRFLQDPSSVDPETRAFFQNWPKNRSLVASPPPSGGYAPSARQPGEFSLGDDSDSSRSLAHLNEAVIARIAAAARLARFIRQRGHIEANVDPLELTPRKPAGLELSDHSLTNEELRLLPSSVVGGPIARRTQNADEAIAELRRTYSGSIGFDDEHIQDDDERYWLRDAAESREFYRTLDPEAKTDLLERLTEVDTFEQYLHRTFTNQKRFSIEGTDMLVPILDEIIHDAAAAGTREVVLGMAHRGRLNVLAHVLGKPYSLIVPAFEAASREVGASVAGKGSRGYSGDVKYHLGFRRAYKDKGVQDMPISLMPNPSHLEFVNPVVEGHARAAQEECNAVGAPVQNSSAALPIAIHGDAAFPGQGVVAETLNLSNLQGYSTGGTIHIIVNNQIGFTTLPSEGRSTLYASDLAKGFEIPIVHVNADDPEACLAVARMAHAYRVRFNKDFLIDLIGYRRYGHNEGELPEITQPRMYEAIQAHPRLRDQWANRLISEGVIDADQSEDLVRIVRDRLQAARTTPPAEAASVVEADAKSSGRGRTFETAVPEERLRALNEQILARPEGFSGNAKLEGQLGRYRAAVDGGSGILWGHAETLAYASILADGVPIRLSGQDSERGTFAHRNIVLHDTVTGGGYCPLQNLPDARASFAVYNSPLSETAVLGFEYGFSIRAPKVLVLWEAQFGDFANGAQVIIDQFVTSGVAKWRQTPSLVMLLPHGYEGQGPEHSSARLERFLQLAANDNIRITNCTSAAQLFHVLRRQAALLESDPKPLIILSPKSLLKHARAASSLAELATGSFQTVIEDEAAKGRADKVTRLILCSGKIYIDLAYSGGQPREEFVTAERIAAVRIEQLYPFPADELKRVVASYPNLREIVWLQEEPRNMGAWSFVSAKLREHVDWLGEFRYLGRPESASPAEGSVTSHTNEQARIVAAALTDAPEVVADAPDLHGWGLGARRAGG